MGGNDKPKMVLLTTNNYAIWKTKMSDRLYVKLLARPIEEEGIRPPNADVREWVELDRRYLGFIREYIDTRVIHHVENSTTAFSYWKKLQGLYERKTTGHNVSLVRQLGKLRSLWILDSLLDSWETLSLSLSNAGHDTLVYENKRGGGKKKLKQHAVKQKSSKKDDKCHYCDKLRHWKSDCYTFKKDVANGTVKNKKNDNNVPLVDHESDLIVVEGDLCYASSGERWVVDSGASFHVTPDKNLFKTYTKGDYGEEKMGNSHVSKITAMGEVHLRSNTGSLLVLKNLRHILDFRMSLISTGKLDDEGYLNLFGKGQWKFTLNGTQLWQLVKDKEHFIELNLTTFKVR
ncbi:hypothetical protein LIER_20426 [Lithospermum erythrorhizon]|uniref:Retrovirus-related Pol polyprotein from transposon TNT 1-94-like beta-barrel domain-containing protein n=1 Tax=Lithospermum erythrorhizon TaxID=34254 RepID=A0AAV3QMV6_LITER